MIWQARVISIIAYATHNNQTAIIIVEGPATAQQPFEDQVTELAAFYGYDLLVYEYMNTDRLIIVLVDALKEETPTNPALFL
jgi:hypothetical protein